MQNKCWPKKLQLWCIMCNLLIPVSSLSIFGTISWAVLGTGGNQLKEKTTKPKHKSHQNLLPIEQLLAQIWLCSWRQCVKPKTLRRTTSRCGDFRWSYRRLSHRKTQRWERITLQKLSLVQASLQSLSSQFRCLQPKQAHKEVEVCWSHVFTSLSLKTKTDIKDTKNTKHTRCKWQMHI